jgi:hypothetical protein
LPDGSKLCDDSNKLLLKKIKRIVFEVRNSPLCKNINDFEHYKRALIILKILDYLVVNYEIYNPKINCFSVLDTAGLIDFLSLYAMKGSFGVAYIYERIEKELYIIIKNSHKCRSDYNLNPSIPDYVFQENTKDNIIKTFEPCDIKIIKSWFYTNGYYNYSIKCYQELKYGMLNRKKLSKLLGLRYNSFSPKIDMLLRQFEFAQDYSEIDKNIRFRDYEYLPTNKLSIEENATKSGSESKLKSVSRTLSALSNICDRVEGLPPKLVFNGIDVEAISIKQGLKAIGHYRTTPIPIALKVINEAIRFVILYGKPLVEYALRCATYAVSTSKSQINAHICDKDILNNKMPQALKPLNIKTAKSFYNGSYHKNEANGKVAAPKVRHSPSLEDALMLLITSIYILTANLSALRRLSLSGLCIGCISGNEGQYDLDFLLPKANFNDSMVLITRPVPNFISRCLALLERFTIGWTSIFGIKGNKQLFWIPFKLGKGNSLDYWYIDQLIVRFCDFIELPLDDNGCRWYILSHECRRFFAIAFFWHFKYASLGALQWMLGHVDPEHIYSYIKETIGGAELTNVEAQFTASAIKNGETETGLNEITRLVLKHFNTSDIQLIEDDDIELYLEYLLEQGIYKLKPHCIQTSEGSKFVIIYEVTRYK